MPFHQQIENIFLVGKLQKPCWINRKFGVGKLRGASTERLNYIMEDRDPVRPELDTAGEKIMRIFEDVPVLCLQRSAATNI